MKKPLGKGFLSPMVAFRYLTPSERRIKHFQSAMLRFAEHFRPISFWLGGVDQLCQCEKPAALPLVLLAEA